MISPTPQEDSEMPLWQHLDELRKVLIRCLLIVGLAMCVTYNFATEIIRFLEAPLLELLPPGEQKLYYTGITDKFFVYLKVSALAAVVLSSPFLFFQIWKFVAPGLKKEERRFAVPFVIFSTVAFLGGMAFAFYLVIPFGYKFLIEFGGDDHQALITLGEYFSLTVKMILAIGCVFEVPVLFVLLGKFGLIDAPTLSKNRRLAFVVSAVVSAIATPSPDAFTMLLVMVPLYLLYEASIVGVRWVNPT